MAQKRIIIETSKTTKTSLDKILTTYNKSLTEWFVEKVEEGITPLQISPKAPLPKEDILDLQQLLKPKLILNQFRKIDWAYTSAETSYLSHNIHPYPAKYIPQIPNRVIQMLSQPGETVWDPFGGSGTTALEAILLGRQVISSDLNPIANIIGQAKTTSLTTAEEEELKSIAEELYILGADRASFLRAYDLHAGEIRGLVPDIPNISKWFHETVIQELALIKWSILNKLSLKAKTVALACFSKIIIKASFQDGETRYVSKPREVKAGAILLMYSADLKATINKVKQLSSILKFREAKFITANVVTDEIVDNNTIDLIVTSPPYPNATDYHLYHRFRIFWLGFHPKELATSEIGSHLRHQKENTEIGQYLSEMKGCLEKMHTALRHGRYAILVVGDGMFSGKVFSTAALLSDVAASVGFETVGIVDRKVHETKRSFVSAGRRLRDENLLILRKKDKVLEVNLHLPPYKLWPYEEVIRKLEVKTLFGDKLLGSDRELTKVSINSVYLNKLRRLTFTHGFATQEYPKTPTWQCILENGDYQKSKSNRKDPKYLSHGIHAYKGKFYPQLAKSLLNLSELSEGATILDPFCGSGTVLLESMLNGFDAFGLDLNPLALKIARAKTNIIGSDILVTEKLVTSFLNKLPSIRDTTGNTNRYSDEILLELKSWFAEPILKKLFAILQIIDEIPDKNVAEWLEVCVSSIVRDISQQDPQDLRIRRRKDPLLDAPVEDLLAHRITEQLRRLMSFSRNAKYASSNIGTSRVVHGDSRILSSMNEAGIKSGKIDGVITSPPYANALPYIDTDRLSILLLFGKSNSQRALIEKSLVGGREISVTERRNTDELIREGVFENIHSPLAIRTIKKIYHSNSVADVGFRKKNTASLLYKYYLDMSKIFQNIDKVTKKTANMFFVIGDNKTNLGDKTINIESGKVLTEIGTSLGWQLRQTIPITVTQENRLHNKNGITNNDIIWFSKV